MRAGRGSQPVPGAVRETWARVGVDRGGRGGMDILREERARGGERPGVCEGTAGRDPDGALRGGAGGGARARPVQRRAEGSGHPRPLPSPHTVPAVGGGWLGR